MLNRGSFCARHWLVPLVIGLLGVATPSLAQPVYRETPSEALSRHIRVLASSPRDFNSLIGAGRAALDLGDVQSAAGFFGRADEVNANAPAAKAGLGAAMAHMGDADGAIFYFNQASRLGAQPLTLALDRGLARDLAGDLGGAQADYRLAISSLGSDEGRRRLALSLAIARDRKGSLDALQPLLNRRDPAAQRTRAFVLALLGDRIAASQAIESLMPGGSARFAPFFQYLPSLSIAEKAAAVHLGIFPENAAARVAAATVPQPQASPPPTVVTRPAPPPSTARSAPPVRTATVQPSTRNRAPSGSFSLPSVQRAAPTATIAAPAVARPQAAEPKPVDMGAMDPVKSEPADMAAMVPVTTEPASTAVSPSFSVADLQPAEGADGNLSGIDKLLATIAEAPPAPRPKVEKAKPAEQPKPSKVEAAAAAKKAADKKKRDDKLAADKKAKEEAARLGVAGTNWVQLAGGSNQDRMGIEYKRLSGKAGSLLKSRNGYVTEGKDYFRLLVGPFDSKGDAQAFVNKLAKEGVDGFSWTRTPPKIKIEKLSSR
jgi:tetratricopeptide (TPR) repeat protein